MMSRDIPSYHQWLTSTSNGKYHSLLIKMLTAYILLSAAIAVYSSVFAQHRVPPQHTSPPRPNYDHFDFEGPPRPYSFSYNAHLRDHVHGDGQISRTESKDETGRVQGSYSLNAEGFSRHVDYVADHLGFRAHVRTNEPGTESKNPADVVMESSYQGHQPSIHGNFRNGGRHTRSPVSGHGGGLFDVTSGNDRFPIPIEAYARP